MNATSRGLISGFLATGPMTYALMAFFRQLPAEQKSPLPPATITDDSLKKAGIRPFVPGELKPFATMGAHFAYGAVLALPYAFLAPRSRRGFSAETVARGSAYGLAVWFANYAGLLPALGMRSQLPRMPAARNGMMIAAHLIWGISVATAEDWLRREGMTMLEGSRRAANAE